MIFVTVGTHTAGFDRLVRAVDDWANGKDEPVTVQIGSTTFEPTHCAWFRFAPPVEIERLMRQARVVVTHAGAGSLMGAIEAGTSVVAVPRQAAYGEHLDDHQLELGVALEAAGLVRTVIDVASLGVTLESAPAIEPPSDAPRTAMIKGISAALAEWGRDR